jgi:acyl-coenzyme A thioesterase PaaI-like protein
VSAAGNSQFTPDGDGFLPTEWAVGPWSADLLQGSAYGGLMVRALERHGTPAGMMLGRLSYDFWRPVTRERITTAVTVLREGRKASTLEASLLQGGRPAARCTALYLKADPASTPPTAPVPSPPVGPEVGRAVPPQVKAWSPFFTGVDTRVIEGDLLKPGPAATWFNLERPLVAGEVNSSLVHAVSAADLAGGISAVVDLRKWSFVNADLGLIFWRMPRAPWILLAAETIAGDQGTGVARGILSDVTAPFGTCTLTLIFERRS